MNKLILIPAFVSIIFFASCHSEESEMTENTSTVNNEVEKERIKAVDYIPPSTNESSAGDTKRKRKFHIR